MWSLHAPLRRRLAVLENRTFRRMLAGRAVSFLGDGLYTVAAMWLVFDLTGSAAYTGLAGFLLRAPRMLKLFAGPLVDRSRLGRVLVGSEALGAGLAAIVPLAALAGELSVWVVLAVLPLMGLTELFAAPAQTAALPRVVEQESLVRANSAFSIVTSAVDAGAKALGGLLIAAFGAVALYGIDAATYAVAALLFLGLAIPDTTTEGEEGESEEGESEEGEGEEGESDGEKSTDDGFNFATYRKELRAGLAVLTGSALGAMLLASLAANFLTSAAFAVLPAYAAALSGAASYGFLLSALTVGTVVGSLVAPAVENRSLGLTSAVGFLVAGALWTLGVEAGGVLLTAVLFGASRVPVGIYNVGVQATMQTGVPDDRLGRVTATVSSLSNVVGPAGLLLGGVAGDAVGARLVLLAGGVGTVLTGLLWAGLPSLRRFGPPTAVEPGSFG